MDEDEEQPRADAFAVSSDAAVTLFEVERLERADAAAARAVQDELQQGALVGRLQLLLLRQLLRPRPRPRLRLRLRLAARPPPAAGRLLNGIRSSKWRWCSRWQPS